MQLQAQQTWKALRKALILASHVATEVAYIQDRRCAGFGVTRCALQRCFVENFFIFYSRDELGLKSGRSTA